MQKGHNDFKTNIEYKNRAIHPKALKAAIVLLVDSTFSDGNKLPPKKIKCTSKPKIAIGIPAILEIPENVNL